MTELTTRRGLCPPRSWIAKTVGEQLFAQLTSELPGSALQSVLLETMRSRAGRRACAELVKQHRVDGFCRPAEMDPRVGLSIDRELFAAAAGFEGVAKLAANRRAVFVATGIGTQLIAARFST